MSTQNDQTISTPEAQVQRERENVLNRRLEAIGWGLFLVMIGGIGLIPDERVPEGTWLIGVGLIMLGINLARYLNNIRMSSFTIVLGVLALLFGLSDFVGLNLPFFPILLILIGINIIIKPFFERKLS